MRPCDNYTKSQSDLIQIPFQGDVPLEEFVTKVHLLVNDSGYPEALKQESLRDNLLLGLNSDKVRTDAIAKGNDVASQQVYEFAKVDESTRVQMKAIIQHEDSLELHAVRKSLYCLRSLSRRTLI